MLPLVYSLKERVTPVAVIPPWVYPFLARTFLVVAGTTDTIVTSAAATRDKRLRQSGRWTLLTISNLTDGRVWVQPASTQQQRPLILSLASDTGSIICDITSDKRNNTCLPYVSGHAQTWKAKTARARGGKQRSGRHATRMGCQRTYTWTTHSKQIHAYRYIGLTHGLTASCI